MNFNVEFLRSRQLVLQQFAGEVVQHTVGRDEFCNLLVSRRPLQRCDDESTHERGLFDQRSGDLFDIEESDLTLPVQWTGNDGRSVAPPTDVSVGGSPGPQ